MMTEGTMDNRIDAVQAYVKALRTGEHSAAEKVATYLAPEVALAGGKQDCAGKAEVLKRVTGQWPNTPTYLQAAWSEVEPEGEALKISGSISGLGAAPAA